MLFWRSRLAAATLGASENFGRWSTGTARAVATPGVVRRPAGTSPQNRDVSSWDLIRDEAGLRNAGAKILYLFGEVMDFDGKPKQDAHVEIWDSRLDAGDRNASDLDPALASHGSAMTDLMGHFMFRTVLPVASPGRAPHICARVTPAVGRELTTQIYLVDEPENARDWHFMSLGPAQQAALSIDPVRRTDGDLEAGFNFVL